MTPALTRRDLLAKCAALGTLTLGSSLLLPTVLSAWEEREKSLSPTPWNELGPFYKRQAPHVKTLRAAGDPGLPLSVSGKVFDVRGNALPNGRSRSGRRITKAFTTLMVIDIVRH
jgi:protocatechuate 3,4-dioxygenase beta subunit